MATIVNIVLALNIVILEGVLIYALNKKRAVKKLNKKGGTNNR